MFPSQFADPPGVVTVTLTPPAACAGVVNVNDVPVLLVIVALFPPMVTVALLRFDPVIVTESPPLVEPLPGLRPEIVGART